MSTSSPVRTRQPRRPSLPSQAGNIRSPRGEAVAIVVRSIPLVIAAVSVIATSNYFAYLIGRKQVAYEELRRQVDRVVQLIDQKRAEEELEELTTLKQQQERLEQNASGLGGLMTSTINGKTTATPGPAPAGTPITAALIDDTAVVPPDHEVGLQPPESSLNATTKHRDMHGFAHQRGSRRQKVSPTSAAPRLGSTEPAIAEQSGQLTTSISATPDAGLAGQ